MTIYSSFFDEFVKIASVPKVLLHPALIGAGLGAAGGAAVPVNESRLAGAARGAVAGGTIGAGIRYLPGMIRKSKMLKELHPYAGDIGWMAPSLVAAPIAMKAGKRAE